MKAVIQLELNLALK